jgi:hypothetical protein
VSALTDAVKALRSLILIEERVTNVARKVESVTDQVIALDKRMVRVETVLSMTMRDGLPRVEGPPR